MRKAPIIHYQSPTIPKSKPNKGQQLIILIACLALVFAISLTSILAASRKDVDVFYQGKVYKVVLYGDETTADAISKAQVTLEDGDIVSVQLNEVVSAGDVIYINCAQPPTGQEYSYYEELVSQQEGFISLATEEEKLMAEAAALAAAKALRAQALSAKAAANVAIQPQEEVKVISQVAGSEQSEDEGQVAAAATEAATTTVGDLVLGKEITVTATGYCPCSKCCGAYSGGQTASGKKAQAYHTIAASSSYSFGTKVYLPYFKDSSNGGIFYVEDRGGAINGNKIDVYFATHSEALAFGRRTLKMYLVEN